MARGMTHNQFILFDQQFAEVDISAQLHELQRRRDNQWLRNLDRFNLNARQPWRRFAKKLLGKRQYG